VRVLILDDNASDRELIRRELAREFPEADLVEIVDADGLTRALDAGAFGAAITDYQLRWTDGLAVLRAVKARLPDCPVIMFTATGTQEVAVAAMKAGVDDYIVKAPQHFVRLPAALRNALERAELRAERRRAEAERARLLEQLAAANRALAQRIADFQTLFDVSPIGVAIAEDPTCRHVRMNATFARLVGLAPDAEGSLTTPPGERPPFKIRREGRELSPEELPMQLAAATGKPVLNAEVEFVLADGRRAHTVGHAAPLFDERGRVRGCLAAFVDVTARKRAEEAQRFLAEAGVRLAASLDLEGTLRAVSALIVPRLADGYALDLLREDGALERVAVGHVDPARAELARELARRYPRRADEEWHPAGRAIRTGKPVLLPDVAAGMLASIGQDPRYVEMLELLRRIGFRSFIVVPLVARGRILGTLSLSIDTSDRRYGDQDLALAEELAQPVAFAVDNARLFREAQQAIREALAATRARDTFLARASHELRTPLTSALGTVRLLKKAAAGRLPESPDLLIDIASRNLTAMVTLIDHLLDAATLEVGRETLVREPVEVAAVVHDSLQIVGTHAREKGVGLRAAVPAGLTAWADRLKLEQVLVNLMANAVKFTPAGGEAVVSAEASGESTLLRVRDTGAGIRPEDLGRIFEPFFQGGEPLPPQPGDKRARRVRGAGLGLAIVKRLVELHGGRVWAESEGPGRGSTFVVVLPQAHADSAAA